MVQFIVILIVGLIILLSSWKPEAILFGIIVLSIIAFIYNQTVWIGLIVITLIIGISIFMFYKDRKNDVKKVNLKENNVKEHNEKSQISKFENEPQIKHKETTKLSDKKITEDFLTTLNMNQYALKKYIEYYQKLSQVYGNIIKIDSVFYGFIKNCYILYTRLQNKKNFEIDDLMELDNFQKVLNKSRILTEIPHTHNFFMYYENLCSTNNDFGIGLYIKEYKQYIKSNNVNDSDNVREDIAFLTVMFFIAMKLAIEIYEYEKNDVMNNKKDFISSKQYQKLKTFPSDNNYIVYYDIDSFKFNLITEKEKIDYLINEDEKIRNFRNKNIKSIYTLGIYNLGKIVERMLASIDKCNEINNIYSMQLVLENLTYIDNKAKENKIRLQNERMQNDSRSNN